jgi:hypothetical protein
MNDLLAIAIEAHGGLGRWNSFTTYIPHVEDTIWREFRR